MAILGTAFFEQQVGNRSVGWEEDLYLLTAQNLIEAMDHFTNYMQQRVKLLGIGPVNTYNRVSQVGNAPAAFRDSQVSDGIEPLTISPAQATMFAVEAGAQYYYAPTLAIATVGGGQPDGSRAYADFPTSGLLVRQEGGSTYQSRRLICLRGILDGVQGPSTATPILQPGSAPWVSAFNNWVSFLTVGPQASRYGFQTLDYTVPTHPVLGVAQTTPWAVNIPSHGLSPTDYVHIYNCKTKKNVDGGKGITINGRWQVASVVDANNVILMNYAGPSPLTKLGFARKEAFAYVPFNKIVMRRWTTRRVGTPFDSIHPKQKIGA
jgi:hypothetical protein